MKLIKPKAELLIQRGFPMLLDGKVIETYNSEDIKKFVEESLPSLVGKDYNIEFAKQRV